MRVEALRVGALETNCYLVFDGEECLIVDPGDDGDTILRRVTDRGARVSGIAITHGHFDHTGAAAFLHDETGAPVYIGRDDARLLADPGWMKPFVGEGARTFQNPVLLVESDTVSCGASKFTVFETPGHSPGSVCFYSPGLGGSPGVLFSGDLLFREGIGRTDLPGGSQDDIIRSITEKVMALPDDTIVYPGHGEATTVFYERTCNPYF